MNDLFQKKSKKQLLLEFILNRNWTKTHEVQEWGLKNFHSRAHRDAQELAEEGYIRRMTSDEEKSIGYFGKEGVWVHAEFKR